MDTFSVAVGAVIAAVVSSVINGRYNKSIKDLDVQAQNTRIALQCAELKHQQLVACQDWNIRTNKDLGKVEFWDPLQSVIEYLDGMHEYRRTGKWSKAEAAHIGSATPR